MMTPRYSSDITSMGVGIGSDTGGFSADHNGLRLVVEDTLPWDMAVYIVSLFFDYVSTLGIHSSFRPEAMEKMQYDVWSSPF